MNATNERTVTCCPWCEHMPDHAEAVACREHAWQQGYRAYKDRQRGRTGDCPPIGDSSWFYPQREQYRAGWEAARYEAEIC